MPEEVNIDIGQGNDIPIKPYPKNKLGISQYPQSFNRLRSKGLINLPKQTQRNPRYTKGLDITFKLRNMSPTAFQDNVDDLLDLAYQTAMRYNEVKWKFAKFVVRLGRLAKGKKLSEYADFTAAMHPDPEILVYGPGYDTGGIKDALYIKAQQIIDIVNRYPEGVSKQKPYVVTELFIGVRRNA